MRRPRKITTAALITSVALLCSAACASASNPLLSGYGGPGEGNQAIVGSTLIGGAGGSGTGSSGSGGAPGAGSSSATAVASEPAEQTGSRRSPSGTRNRSPGRGSGKSSSHASNGERDAYQSAKTIDSGPTSDSRTLGLSGDDVLYIILALVLLAAIAALTARVGVRSQRDARG